MSTGDAFAARAQHGFTLIAVLLALALLALATERVTWVLSQQAQREREARMLRIGADYVAAIASYHQASPGGTPAWPRELSELLEDRRFAGVRRHLRELYPEPLSGQAWEPVRRNDGSVEGVQMASHRFVFRPEGSGPSMRDTMFLTTSPSLRP